MLSFFRLVTIMILTVVLLFVSCDTGSSSKPKGPVLAPGAPTITSQTAGNTQIAVSWTAVSGAKSYEVWYHTANNSASASKWGSDVTATSSTITGLTNDTIYYIWVKAKNSAGTSGFSLVASTSPTVPAVTPDAPPRPNVTSGDAQIAVSWTAVSGATAYEVWYLTADNSGSALKWGSDVTATSSTITGLTNDIIYYVWVKAKNSAGTSGFSLVASTSPTVPVVTPDAPGLPILTAASLQITVSWTVVSGATAYEIWYHTVNNSASASKWGSDVTGTSTIITGLTNGTTYYVWIKAKNSAGTSGFSLVASTSPTVPVALPDAPGTPSLTAGNTQIAVSWTAVSGATAYEVWYHTANNSASASKWGSDVTGTSTTITGLTNGTAYYVWLKAKNSAGTSGFSPGSSSTPVIPVPIAPGTPSLTAGNTQIAVSWTAVSGATAYEVWYHTANNSASASKWGSDIAGTSATITGLTNGTAYYVWLKAKNSTGTSGFSPVSSSTPVVPVPGAPTITALTAGNTQISVSWTVVSGATAYEVWYHTANNSASASKWGSDVSGTTSTITGLTNGTAYYVWVKVKNSAGTSGFSASASGTPAAPDPVSLVTTQAESMTTSGPYTGTISSPFNGMALYGNGDTIQSDFNFQAIPGIYRLDIRGASDNSNTAKVSVYIDTLKVGEASFTGTSATTSSLAFSLTEGVTGNRPVKLVCDADTGAWNVYIDSVELFFLGTPPPPPELDGVPDEPVSESGNYRNLFKEIGKTETEVQDKIDSAFTKLFYGSATEKIYYTSGTDMAYIYTADTDDVRSEGMSYGMMMCVQLDKKAEFDRLWKFAQTYMQHKTGARTGYFAWQVGTNGAIKDQQSAPDGEEYFAMSLYFAWKRWGNGTGIYNYKAEADNILNHMVRHRTLLSLQSWNGDSENMIGQNNSNGRATAKQVVFVPYGASADHTDPSYHLPAFYELWALWAAQDNTLWGEVAAASRQLFRNACNSTTGLAPDYSGFDGTPTGGSHVDFRYDAWRVAMNISLDSVWWNKDSWQRSTWVDKYLGFFESKGISSHGALFTLSGTQLNADHSPGLVAMNATAALISDDPEAWKFVEELWNTSPTTGTYRYYDGCLYMFGMLVVSGNYRIIQ